MRRKHKEVVYTENGKRLVNSEDLILSVSERRIRCELCGRLLDSPETDFRKIAICKKCLKGQLE
jgi:hypothetical protein